MNDFDELRSLLLSEEQEQIRRLRERTEDRAQRARDVSAVLPHAVKLSRETGGELARALQPSIGVALRDSIKEHPEPVVEAFFPIIGPLVRRSIKESLSGMLQTFNRALNNTLSWQGLKWRIEALRTGRSFADVVMLRSLAYRVEQIVLFHRETSVALLNVSLSAADERDADMGVGMLSALQDFGRDWLKAGEKATLSSFEMKDQGESRDGDQRVWLVPERHAYLAVLLRGEPPLELRTKFIELLESVHVLKGAELANFQGDTAPFEALRPDFEDCLVSQQREPTTAAPQLTRVWLAAGTALAIALGATLAAWRSAREWRDFQARLRAEPGIIVTNAEKHWIGASRVSGLRDPLARDPARIAEDAQLNDGRVIFDFKSYRAQDPAIVRKRFADLFRLPEGVALTFADDQLTISGSAPFEWLTEVREKATRVPGIDRLHERELRVTFDPALVLARFAAAFPPTPEVHAAYAEGTLRLSGSAAYEWLAPVRARATQLPGIQAIDENELKVRFDPALVLRRFTDRFGLPESVAAQVENGALLLSGEASHAWLERVRRGATEVPGITTLAEKQVVDLDQRTYQQSKSIIESAVIYFLPNKADFATEGFAALSRLPDEIRRCLGAAARLGISASIQLRGSADATGLSAKNVELSQERAEAVCRFLVKCELDPNSFTALGIGAPAVDGIEKPVGEQSQRRVAFRVVEQQDPRAHDPEKSLSDRHFQRRENEPRRAVCAQHFLGEVPDHRRREDRQESRLGGRHRSHHGHLGPGGRRRLSASRDFLSPRHGRLSAGRRWHPAAHAGPCLGSAGAHLRSRRRRALHPRAEQGGSRAAVGSERGAYREPHRRRLDRRADERKRWNWRRGSVSKPRRRDGPNSLT